MKTAEEIFAEQANKHMMKFNLSEFKRSHPKLFMVIKRSMQAYAEQSDDNDYEWMNNEIDKLNEEVARLRGEI